MSKTVLLVDCDTQFVVETQAKLTADGYNVVTAENRADADAKLAQQDFDVAILSLKMEHADSGFTLAYHIKQKSADTHVIMTSCVEFDSMTDEEQSWTKADTILIKPVRYEQVKAEMNKIFA